MVAGFWTLDRTTITGRSTVILRQHTTPFRPMIVPFDDLELVYQRLRTFERRPIRTQIRPHSTLGRERFLRPGRGRASFEIPIGVVGRGPVSAEAGLALSGGPKRSAPVWVRSSFESGHNGHEAALALRLTELMQCSKNLAFDHLVSDRREPTRLQGSRPERLHFGEGGISSFRLLEQGRNPRPFAARQTADEGLRQCPPCRLAPLS